MYSDPLRVVAYGFLGFVCVEWVSQFVAAFG